MKIDLAEIHNTYIKGKRPKEHVTDAICTICRLPRTIQKDLNLKTQEVAITTRALKHIYDRRSHIDYQILITIMPDIIRFPDRIYSGKEGKKGEYYFIKTVANRTYLCILDMKKGSIVKM